MHTSNLETLFSPRSIAVIGASTTPFSVGNDIAKNLITGDFDGDIFLVNPKTDRLFDTICYPDISSVPETPDLAIIVIPAQLVPEALREVGKKGIRTAIIISAGFRETGVAGQSLESEVIKIADSYGMTLLGPNCLGFLHPKIGLNASFAPTLPAAGSIAFFSQSGAIMTALLDITRGRLGFSKFVSTGNKASLDEKALLSYFGEDADTKVISFYSENMTDASECVRIGRSIITRPDAKPVLALKSGRSESGIKATSSHTGALAGADTSYDALFTQSRILRVDTLHELLNGISIFSQNPEIRGNSVAIITNAGGEGVLATDAVSKAGLVLADISDTTKSALRDILPRAASIENPIDLLGDAKADLYEAALDILSQEPGIDALLVIVTPQSMTEAEKTAEAIIKAKISCDKPVIAVFSGAFRLEGGVEVLEKAGATVFRYPEEAAQALGHMARFGKWRKAHFSEPRTFDDIRKEKAQEIFARVFAEERTALYEREAYEVLRAYGFPLLKSFYARTPEEAMKSAREIGSPVALKIVSPDIIHKTELGGVMLDVPVEDVGARFGELLHRVRMKAPNARLEGVMVVEMALAGGKELILGAKKDGGLGTILVIGMGGIYTEVFRDVAFRFAPLIEEDAQEMLSELKSLPLLSGTRGEDAVDMPYLTQLLLRLSRLVSDFPEIQELDINPLNVFPDADNFRVIDARILIADEDAGKEAAKKAV
mgnify:CR=1 FL=1